LTRIENCQLAALKLVEQGKISFDTPLSDYLPEFRNPIIVEKTSTQKTKFTPAKTVVTLKHVLNFSSGLFYPVVREDLHGLSDGYASKEMHTTQDPTSAFFRIVIVRFVSWPRLGFS
jgi:CubicO group peptidase (beta-lactamase class C family)